MAERKKFCVRLVFFVKILSRSFKKGNGCIIALSSCVTTNMAVGNQQDACQRDRVYVTEPNGNSGCGAVESRPADLLPSVIWFL